MAREIFAGALRVTVGPTRHERITRSRLGPGLALTLSLLAVPAGVEAQSAGKVSASG